MVADFLWEEEARYVVVVDVDFEDEDWTENAERVVEAEDIYAGVIAEVAEAEGESKTVIFILDEELDSDLELLESAMDAGLECLDLASGLAKLDVQDSDEEDEVEPEEDADEDDEEEAMAEVELPPGTQKLIDAGEFEDAGLKLAEELTSPKVRKLADEVGVTYEKGVWAKTIAADIIAKLFPESVEEEVAEDVTDEPQEAAEEAEDVPEVDDTPKPKKRASKKQEPVEEPATDEGVLTGLGDDDPRLAQSMAQEPTISVSDARFREIAIINAAHVAGAKGTGEAGKFLDLLKSHGLLS
ncbi:MAG: hypothetical protein ABR616_15635 [Dermatophilaceae bacterium]